jgi:NAD(P)H dehydrogenase (quinone)
VVLGVGHENKDYDISNTENHNFSDVARILSEVFGKTVTYTDPGQEAFRAALSGAGVPGQAVELAAGFAEAIKQGEFISSDTDLERLLGRMPVSLETYLTQTYAS